MKKLSLLVTTALLGFSLGASAAVVITETPIELQKQGNVYMVPTGTTAKYYYYNDDSMRYVCTNETVDVANVNPITMNVTVGTDIVSTKCYPANYFVTEAR